MDWQQVATGAAVLAAGVAGYLIGDYRGEIELQGVQLEAAVLRANQGRQAYERLVEVQDALDAARADRAASDREWAERVRKLNADRKRQASSDQCRDERAAVARCEGLLREGVGLLGEGRGLLQRNAEVHDALIGLVK